MKQRLLFLLTLFLLLTAVMVLQKPLFMLIEPAYTLPDMSQSLAVIWHGLPMDLSMAAYLTALPTLWMIVSIWTVAKWVRNTMRGYLMFVSLIIVLAALTDAMLYPYWGYRLDSTPLFYITTSPTAAMASIVWWQYVVMIVLTVVLTWLLYKLLSLTMRLFPAQMAWHRILSTLSLVIVAGLLIIPIRGGVTVSTMAPGRVYFTSDMRFNQAALNPIFNFMHSVTHADKLSQEYRYFSDTKVDAILAAYPLGAQQPNKQNICLSTVEPDIYLIILESFSAHLMPSLGGEAIAMQLDSIARTGVCFTNFYAESFRTDRALATILSGMPAMPGTSVLKYAKKFGNLPSLSGSLRQKGYETNYYYGGDINFTNLGGYLAATGFKHIVSDNDFPPGERLSKWGAPDHAVFERALAEAAARPAEATPSLNVIQTSSSHEPFDVPYHKFDNERVNAFAYADSCLGAFVNALNNTPRGDKSLIVIVADHWGAYPQVDTPPARHHVPLVMTGTALQGTPARIGTPGSQSAIAPTILTLLGMPTDKFPAARNLLAADTKGQYAWFNEPEWYVLLTANNDKPTVVRTADNTVTQGDTLTANRARAFVQHIYHNLDKM